MTKPFLKWAGGKHRLLPRLRAALPPGKRLIEPFCGSAAVFLGTDYPSALLADSNEDIIGLYRQIQRDSQAFLAACDTLFIPDNNTADRYTALRTEFNQCTEALRRAALFVYLNRHGFNGLCRYNSKGIFNVPFGRYTAPKLPVDAILAFAEKSRCADFVAADFRLTMAMAKPGDVVYCDPPYVPLSATAQFTRYGTEDFREQDQQDLADMATALRRRGIPVIISNHDTPFTRTAYAAAAHIETFLVQRFISSDTQNRSKAAELVAIFV